MSEGEKFTPDTEWKTGSTLALAVGYTGGGKGGVGDGEAAKVAAASALESAGAVAKVANNSNTHQ